MQDSVVDGGVSGRVRFARLYLAGLSENFAGFYLNGFFVAAAAWFASLPVVWVVGGRLYKIMPKDETTAVEQKSLAGRVGVVVLGEAQRGSQAEVRVKDGFGQQHYAMAEPDDGSGCNKARLCCWCRWRGIRLKRLPIRAAAWWISCFSNHACLKSSKWSVI